MAQFMMLLHQDPSDMADLPRDKMMEIIQRYMAWSTAMREKGAVVGGEKLTNAGGRHVRFRDGKPVASDGPYAEAKDVIGFHPRQRQRCNINTDRALPDPDPDSEAVGLTIAVSEAKYVTSFHTIYKDDNVISILIFEIGRAHV